MSMTSKIIGVGALASMGATIGLSVGVGAVTSGLGLVSEATDKVLMRACEGTKGGTFERTVSLGILAADGYFRDAGDKLQKHASRFDQNLARWLKPQTREEFVDSILAKIRAEKMDSAERDIKSFVRIYGPIEFMQGLNKDPEARRKLLERMGRS